MTICLKRTSVVILWFSANDKSMQCVPFYFGKRTLIIFLSLTSPVNLPVLIRLHLKKKFNTGRGLFISWAVEMLWDSSSEYKCSGWNGQLEEWAFSCANQVTVLKWADIQPPSALSLPAAPLQMWELISEQNYVKSYMCGLSPPCPRLNYTWCSNDLNNHQSHCPPTHTCLRTHCACIS